MTMTTEPKVANEAKSLTPAQTAEIARANAGRSEAAAVKRAAAMVRIVEALKGGTSRSSACAVAGVSTNAFYEWLAFDPQETIDWPERNGSSVKLAFGDAVSRAEGEAIARAALQVMQAGRSDWRALAWWLEHYPGAKMEWGEVRRNVISGPQGGPIRVSGGMTFKPDPAWEAEYKKALEELPAEVGMPMVIDGISTEVVEAALSEVITEVADDDQPTQ